MQEICKHILFCLVLQKLVLKSKGWHGRISICRKVPADAHNNQMHTSTERIAFNENAKSTKVTCISKVVTKQNLLLKNWRYSIHIFNAHMKHIAFALNVRTTTILEIGCQTM